MVGEIDKKGGVYIGEKGISPVKLAIFQKYSIFYNFPLDFIGYDSVKYTM